MPKTMTPLALARSAWAHIDGHDLQSLEGVFSPDVQFSSAGTTVTGPAAVRQLVEEYYRAFPDMTHEIESTTEVEDRVWVELRVAATHEGPLPVGDRLVEPTGRPVEWRAATLVRAADGRIIEWRTYFDRAAMLRQIGVLSG